MYMNTYIFYARGPFSQSGPIISAKVWDTFKSPVPQSSMKQHGKLI